MNGMTGEKRTPLYERHVALGARMVPFAGFLMPLQYSGIRSEHEAVRKAAGLFDVSHMGNFLVRGKGAETYLQALTVNNVARLGDLQAQYSALCRPEGSVVDDIIVYRLGRDEFMVVVNAANIPKDWQWFQEHLSPDAELTDASERMGILALQGPGAISMLDDLCHGAAGKIASFDCGYLDIAGKRVLCARTGYTGEDGMELFPAAEDSVVVWDALIQAGSEIGLLPVGLGARDTLRLEAGLSLYGHELTEETHLIEAGLKWIVDLEKGDFLGREALKQAADGLSTRKLVGLQLQEKAIPREGYPVACDGRIIGRITSGTLSPTLGRGIALAYVQKDEAKLGRSVQVLIRDTPKQAEITSRYFYRRK